MGQVAMKDKHCKPGDFECQQRHLEQQKQKKKKKRKKEDESPGAVPPSKHEKTGKY